MAYAACLSKTKKKMSTPIITLNPSVKDKDLQKWKEILEDITYAQLIDVLSPLKEALTRVGLNYAAETDAETRREFDDFKNKPLDELTQQHLISVYAKLTPEDVLTIVKAAAPDYLKVWQALITHRELSFVAVNDILGHAPHNAKRQDYYLKIVQDVLLKGTTHISTGPLFHVTGARYVYNESRCFEGIGLSDDMITYVYEHLSSPKESQQSRPLENLPADNETFSYESQIVADLSELYKLAMGNVLPPKPYSMVKLKALSREVNILPFGSDKFDSGLSRSHLLIAAYSRFYEYRKDVPPETPLNLRSAKEFSRFVMNILPTKLDSGDFLAFLPNFNGFNKDWARNDATHCDIYVKALISIIQECSNQWIETENFPISFRKIISDFIPAEKDRDLFKPWAQSPYYGICGIKRISDGGRATSIKWWNEISFPFFVAYLRLLQACGILEVGTSGKGNVRMMGVDYIKLTNLGRYALGITDEYTEHTSQSNESVNEYSFCLDSNDTIIRLSLADSPNARFLKQIGETITDKTFKISPTSIIRASKSSEDVNKFLNLLQETFCPNPTGVWQQLIDEVNHRIHCEQPRPAYCLEHPIFVKIEVDLSVPGLEEYINKNFELGTVLYRDDDALLIDTNHLSSFKSILHEGGYLL